MVERDESAKLMAEVLEAVAWCRLGSSSGAHPSDRGFHEAERLGLLKHHPTWHATARGEGALIAAGRLAGEPAPETAAVWVLWAVSPSYPEHPNFVAAFSDGLVDAWPATYAEERAKAEAFYRDFVPDATFFLTGAEVVRPHDVPSPADAAVAVESV